MKERIKIKLYGVWVLLLFPLLICCKKEDDYVYPPVLTEILSAGTTAGGYLSYLHTDKGKTYRAINGERISGLSPDTLYRVIGVYEITGEESKQAEALIYSLKMIVSPNPVKADRISGGIKTDPVEIQSIWRSGDYINLALLVKAQNGKHSFHFIQTDLKEEGNCKKLYLALYHDRGDDVEAYTQTAYLSVPLAKYQNILEPGDSILFSINTYKGLKVYHLVY